MKPLRSVLRLSIITLLSVALFGSIAEITNVVTALVPVCIGLAILVVSFEEQVINELNRLQTIFKNEANND